MLFFAAVNGAALIATIFAVPDLPVKEKLSYGSQLSVLKESKTWLSIVGVMFLNGSIFGVYSYLSEYMETVTQLSAGLISILLLVYGLSNIIGNLIAGRMLSSRPLGFVVTFPFLLAAVYAVLFFQGYFTVPMAVLTFVWGVLAGAGANINQYWLATAAPKAPDFANFQDGNPVHCSGRNPLYCLCFCIDHFESAWRNKDRDWKQKAENSISF